MEFYRGLTEAGYYKLAKSAAAMVGYLVGPLQSATYPRLARLWGLQRIEDIRRRVKQLALYIGVPLGIVAFLAAFLVPYALPILVGDAYLPAVTPTQILIAGSSVWLAFFWLRPTFLAIGEIKSWFGVRSIGILLVLVGMPIAISRWGIVGLSLWLGPARYGDIRLPPDGLCSGDGV